MFNNDEADIFSVLKRSREIIKGNSALRDIPLENLFNYMSGKYADDMPAVLGVLAYFYIENIDCSSNDRILESIKKKPCEYRYRKYTMFILQKKYHFSVFKLLIDIEKMNLASPIITYFADNIIYEESIPTNKVLEYLDMICNCGQEMANRLLFYYTSFVINKQDFKKVFKLIYCKNDNKYIEFLRLLLNEIYDCAPKKGEELTIEMLNNFSSKIFCLELMLEGLRLSVYTNTEIFSKYFSFILKLTKENYSWKKIIPIFIIYINRENYEDDIKEKILRRLKLISQEDDDVKCVFLTQVAFLSEPRKEIGQIVDNIIDNNIINNSEVLRGVSGYYYKMLSDDEKGDLSELVIEKLYIIFIKNNYTNENYKNFFDSVIDVLNMLKKNQKVVWNFFLKSFKGKSSSCLWFSLGIYEYILERPLLSTLADAKLENAKLYIYIIKFILFFGTGGEQIVKFIFDVVKFIPKERMDLYVGECATEMYSVYPYTSARLANEYKNGNYQQQITLAKLLNKKHALFIKAQEKRLSVPDFNPSLKFHEINNDIRNQINMEINKAADEKSIFSQIFPKVVLKYGNKVDVVKRSQHNTVEHVDMEYSCIKFEYEMPMLYMRDPVDFIVRCNRIIKERGEFVEISD